MEPTKSGIIGMICSAMGKPRDEFESGVNGVPSLGELASLKMAVRADREGEVMRDFQTAGGGRFLGSDYGVARADGTGGAEVISERFFLSDALFLVVLMGGRDLLTGIEKALRNPVWPIYFGRKAFVPAAPVCMPGGLVDDISLVRAVRSWPWLAGRATGGTVMPDRGLRAVIECGLDREGEIRYDVPVSFSPGGRRYVIRKVREERIWRLISIRKTKNDVLKQVEIRS